MTRKHFETFSAQMQALGYNTHDIEKRQTPRRFQGSHADVDLKGLETRARTGPPRGRGVRAGISAEDPPTARPDGSSPDLRAIYTYDSARQVDYYRLEPRSDLAAQWLDEHPPEGPEHNTVRHRDAGKYFLAAGAHGLYIRVE